MFQLVWIQYCCIFYAAKSRCAAGSLALRAPLDPARVRELALGWQAAHAALIDDLTEFDDFLDGLAHALGA